MLTELQKATGVGDSFQLGGKTFFPSRLTMLSLAEVRAFIRSKVSELPNPIDLVKPSLKGLSAEERRVVLDKATDLLLTRLRVNSPETVEASLSAEAMAFEIWHGIKKRHPEVKYDDVLGYVNESDFEHVFNIRNQISSLSDNRGERNGTADENPTANLRVIPGT